MLVGRSWFNLGEKMTISRIVQECEEQGLRELDGDGDFKLRPAFIHLGNELVQNNLVELKKPVGLTHYDIVRLL